MTGAELIIGGQFASSVIRKVVNLGSSYLGDNYNLHTGTKEMISKLVFQLHHIQSVIEAAEERQITKNKLGESLELLKNVAYEAEDVLDKFEAKRILESIKGKGKVSESGNMIQNLFFPDRELNELKSLVNKLDDLCKGDFNSILLELIRSEKRKEHWGNLGRETNSSDVTIFGRKREIELILDMILNVLYGDFHYQDLDNRNLQQGEGEGSNTFLGLPTILNVLHEDSYHQDLNVRNLQQGEGERSNTFWGLPTIGRSVESLFTWSRDLISRRSEEQVYMSNLFEPNISFRSQTTTTITELQSISKRKLAVIPIVGVGGVGKTAVAKTIYNDERVNEHFALRAWVYVSESSDAKKIMQEILCSFEHGINLNPFLNLENVGNKLKETITNQRFILILDNLRDRTELEWSDLRSVLCYGEVGSVVVVTTQSMSIANTIGTLPEVTLDVLQPELSFWELFHYYAFGFKLEDLNKQPPSLRSKQEELKLIGKQIAEKLHGLPLAGKVMGTLLSKKLEREFWDDIRRSDWWDIEGAREKILPSIGVGYNYLGPELKQCFVFCSIFPKHYVFERERLVQMWIAHGFIQPGKEEKGRLDKGKIRLEDIGRKWFGKLVDRSFFQPTLSDGKYVMHDLVRDLATAVSSNELCFIKSHDNHLPSLARHVGIDCDNSEVEWKCEDNKRLRTVILFGNWTNCSAKSISNIFSKYNVLRVLDLSYILLETNEPIKAACHLWHLRFVDLSFTDISSIPDEICALCHLQVLDLRGCRLTKLPKRMNQLINLRHLYASPSIISQISSIGKLTMLQELEEFHIDKRKGHGISELMNMNEISGHLLLCNLNNVSSKEEADKSQLDKKKYLKSLDLRFDYSDCEQKTDVKIQVLNALKPVCSLEILKVGGCRWESFPGWVFSPHHGFNNLKVVHVYSFELSRLPAFGELPSLEVLSFDNLPLIRIVGSEFYGSSNVAFPSLKELTFSDMQSWQYWSAGRKIIPHLKKLHMEQCGVLELPTLSFSSVVELILSYCIDLRNIERVLQRMPSLSHLSIKFHHCNTLSINCTLLNSLEVMDLKNIKQPLFVGGLKSLVNLRKLVIDGFHEILESGEVEQESNEISQEENKEQCLKFLTYMHLRHFYENPQSLPRLGRLSSLRTLLIENSPAEEYTIEEESWFNQLTSLEKLEFRNCWYLRFLPSQLHLLTSLKKLHINRCHTLLSLPENGLPERLVELYIDYCPDLIRRCQPNQGDDWHKISHIPVVQFKEERRTILR